jgi:4-hydroxybenzoate polyprenyltransferase
VKKENVEGHYIGSHVPSVIAWFIMLSLSLYILLNDIFKQMKKREGETNEKD